MPTTRAWTDLGAPESYAFIRQLSESFAYPTGTEFNSANTCKRDYSKGIIDFISL